MKRRKMKRGERGGYWIPPGDREPWRVTTVQGKVYIPEHSPEDKPYGTM